MLQQYRISQDNNQVCYSDDVENVSLVIPNKIDFIGMSYPEEPKTPDLDMLVKDAIDNPLSSLPLSTLAKGKRNATILVSDATRAVATARVLPHIVKELEKVGMTLSQIRLIVAIGVHRDATAEEMKQLAGIYDGKIAIENHDPFTPEKLVTLGASTHGNIIQVNKTVYESDLRICIGKIEPHEFAGYSGGRKSVLPGIASESCILYNHRPEMILNQYAVSGVLNGNPIHEDMLEAALMLGIDFCVNLVQNAKGEPLEAFAGNIEKAHLAGIAYLKKHFGVCLKERADIYLVTPGYPLNIDLYQSIKSLVALAGIVKQGDTIVIYSACLEGTNSEDMVEPFYKSDTLDGVIDYLTKNYRVQMDHALLLSKLYQKGVTIIAHCLGVKSDILKAMRMTPADSVEEALEIAVSRYPTKSPRLMIFPMPQRMVLE